MSIRKLSHFQAIAIIVLSTFLFRLPFFFRATFDWDESTYILVTQSILDGHLPYIELWELKPPLTFFSYALPLVAFGKSIISVRLFGSLCVMIAAILTYYVCCVIGYSNLSLLTSVIFILLTGPLMGGKSLMTEHIAIVPLLGALALLLRESKLENIKMLLVGFLVSSACMIRLNLAYLGLILGLYIATKSIQLKPKTQISLAPFAYTLGFSIPVIATCSPYFLTNNDEALQQFINAALAYSSSQASVWELMFKQIYDVWGIIFLVGGWQIIKLIRNTKNLSYQQQQLIYCFIFFLMIEWSILKSGGSYSHYMIQLAPFFAVILASGFLRLLSLMPKLGYFPLILTVIAVTLPALDEYKVVGNRLLSGQSVPYGKEYDIAEYLSQTATENSQIYMMQNHLVYWLMDIKPPTKIVHPSNISKEYLLRALPGTASTTREELLSILNKKPEFIVKNERVWYLEEHPEATDLLEKTLESDYLLVNNIQGAQIYRKK